MENRRFLKKIKKTAGYHWFMPVILDIWEAEISRITVQG
jgi:hypothetical protein